jgi:hypothetical protein
VSAAALLGALAEECSPFGLNLIGVASAAEYDALVPAKYRLAPTSRRAAIVIGNGGGAFWSAYRAHVDRHRGFDAREHPLDDFTAEIMETRILPLATSHGVGAELRLPFRASEPPVSFVHLAEAAGLGRRSILAVLIHPEFGPWIALRGALLIDEEIEAPRPAAHFDPCPSCVERPCITTCPARAVAYPAGWDVGRCVDYRIEHESICPDRCEARIACVYGRAHRYPADALMHHHRRAFAVMRRARAEQSAAER